MKENDFIFPYPPISGEGMTAKQVAMMEAMERNHIDLFSSPVAEVIRALRPFSPGVFGGKRALKVIYELRSALSKYYHYLRFYLEVESGVTDLNIDAFETFCTTWFEAADDDLMEMYGLKEKDKDLYFRYVVSHSGSFNVPKQEKMTFETIMTIVDDILVEFYYFEQEEKVWMEDEI